MRLAISCFHASSTDGSTVSSRLSSSDPAKAARASGGRAKAFFKSSETSGLMEPFYARQANREKMCSRFRLSPDFKHFPAETNGHLHKITASCRISFAFTQVIRPGTGQLCLYITILGLALEFGNALRVSEGQYRDQTEKGTQQDMPSSSVGKGFCFHAQELTPELARLPNRYGKRVICVRDLDGFGFWSGHRQTFNNPKCQHWPTIFWPGYTAALTGRGTDSQVAPSK